MKEFFRNYLDADPQREGTLASKWDARKARFGSADVIPLWVADMDFPTVPEVRDALVARAQHPLYGYTMHNEREREAIINWNKRRFGLDIELDWLLNSPGVVDSMLFTLRALSEPGDLVLVQPPVYGPFFNTVKKANRTLRLNPLIEREDGWYIDFDDMETAMREGVRLMMLCNPHNPVGRIWTEQEMSRTFEIAARYGAIIIVDEIHADFTMPGHKPCRALALDNSENVVVLGSASKSFNLAGLRQSFVIAKNAALRQRIYNEFDSVDASSPNIFGALAQTTALENGDEWMDAVVEYIAENHAYVASFILKNLPQVKAHPLEGSYLLWLDFRALDMDQDELNRFMTEEAGIGMNSGTEFGELGRGFMRMNLATQHKNIVQAMKNMAQALDRRTS